MEIKTIRSSEKTQLSPLEILTLSKPPTLNSSTSRSTWKKFMSDATPCLSIDSPSIDTEEAPVADLYEQLVMAWELRKFDEVLKGIELILDKHWPAMDALVRAVLLSIKSKCYEEMDQFDLALIEAEKALDVLKGHEEVLDEFQKLGANFFDLNSFLQTRKAGLLLLNGREEEGFALLKAHPPHQVSLVLLYRLIEKEANCSLLEPKPTSQDDARSLFFAGRYEEVLEKTDGENLNSGVVQVRAAALAMLGRTDEAIQCYRDMPWAYSLDDEDEGMYVLLQALGGDLDALDRDWAPESEVGMGVPMLPFAKWLTGRHNS